MSANNRHFDKVVVENAGGKREKFGLYHDVNTTMDIGDLQPLCCRLLVPNSKTTMSARHLIRLDPMVAPTFGRLKQKTWHHFVGMSELTRKFSALLSKQRVTGASNNQFFTPQTLPYASISDISALCLVGADYSVYCWDPSSSTTADDDSATWILYKRNDSATGPSDIRSWLQSGFNNSFSSFSWPGFGPSGAVDLNVLLGSQYSSGSWIPTGREEVSYFLHRTAAFDYSSSGSFSEVSLKSADYVVRNSFTSGSTTYQLSIAIRLSAFGKRIRKILIGCGYQVNFENLEYRSLMPLFAYYKAYFDTFGLAMYESWESTFAKLVLERYDSNVAVQFGITQNTDDKLFLRFVTDLANCYYTEDYDYVSAHQIQDAGTPTYAAAGDVDKARGFVNNIVLNSAGTANGLSGIGQQLQTGNTVPSTLTNHVYINRQNHTEIDAKLLKLLYKWTNRETAAGRRIAELLRAGGFGKYVDEQKSNFIGYEELDIQVTDVNATADSSNTSTGANSILGEYVGKGIGVSQGDVKSFSFENDEFGYWITLSCMVPESGYCQGEDLLNKVLSADDFYSRDFDALGMELEPNSLVVGGTDWQNPLDNAEVAKYSASFGMVPRHTKWKVKSNVCNGDVSLASTRSSWLPFTFDKWISVGNRDCVDVTPAADVGSKYVYRVVKNLGVKDLPVGGQPWRYLNRYPWLNNFTRIFADTDSDLDRFQKVLRGVITIGNYEYVHGGKDHFLVLNSLDMVTYAPMKPISESYGTFDDEKPVPNKTTSRA